VYFTQISYTQKSSPGLLFFLFPAELGIHRAGGFARRLAGSGALPAAFILFAKNRTLVNHANVL
jgi:hypothetical protein